MPGARGSRIPGASWPMINHLHGGTPARHTDAKHYRRLAALSTLCKPQNLMRGKWTQHNAWINYNAHRKMYPIKYLRGDEGG